MGSIIDTEMNCIAPYTLVIYCWRLLASITYKIKKPDGALKTDAVDGYFQLVALNNYERGISTPNSSRLLHQGLQRDNRIGLIAWV